MLKSLKLKTGREDRIVRLTRLHANRQQQTRLARLVDLRHKSLEELPQGEREALELAFQGADSDDAGMLSGKQLKNALKGLGLVARNEVEKIEIGHIVNEVSIAGDVNFLGFVFEAVPRARQKLRELRSGALERRFRLYDADDSGQLSTEECAVIFEHLCVLDLDSANVRTMRRLFDEKVRKVRDPNTGQVSFEGFEILMTEVQEQVQRVMRDGEAQIEVKEGLEEADMKAHQGELISLYEAYRKVVRDDAGLSRQRVRILLVDRCLQPHDEHVQEKLDLTLDDIIASSNSGGLLSFRDFLRVVRFMREMIVSGSHFELSQMFTRLDKARRGYLQQSSILSLISMLGIVPRNREDQAELRRLLAEVNANGSGEVSFPEFERLVLRVKERMRASQRHRIKKAVQELRMKDAELEILLDLFQTVDTDCVGFLSAEQLRKVLDMMQRPVSQEDLEATIARICPDTVMDFEKFLRFVRATNPPEG